MANAAEVYSNLGNRFGITGPFYGPAGHRGQDFKMSAGGVVPAYKRGVVVDSDFYSKVLGYVVVVKYDDGRFAGWAHLRKGTRPAVGTIVNPGDQIGLAAGAEDDHGTAWTGAHIHTTLGPAVSSVFSGVTYDPLPYIRSALSGISGAGGGVIPIDNYGYGLTTEAQLAAQAALSKLGYYNGVLDGKFGDQSVTAFQQYLKDNGYLPADYDVDGQPGPKYGTAVQQLAQKYGYKGDLDGAPGGLTSAAIVAWSAAVTADKVDYAFGLTVDAQKAVQTALSKLSLYGGLIDGAFGPRSVTSFQTYLKSLGFLPSNYNIDGVPGPTYGMAIQTLAARHGYTGKIDGAPGGATSTAIIRWADTITDPANDASESRPDEIDTPLPGSWGIDIATAQANIDLNQAKAKGVQFAIVKLGGLNVQPQYVSPYYTRQVDAARAAGLYVGHYYVVGKGQTPEEEAEYFVKNLHNFDKDKDILALDNETLDSNGVTWKQDDALRFFVRVIQLTGINPKRLWHYAGANDYRNLGPWDKLVLLGVRFWWAAYGSNPSGMRPDHTPDLRGAIPDWHIHQYSSTTEIGGVDNVDANYSRLTVDELFNFAPVILPPVEPEKPDEEEPDETDEEETEVEPLPDTDTDTGEGKPDEEETVDNGEVEEKPPVIPGVEGTPGSTQWISGVLILIAGLITTVLAYIGGQGQ